MRTRILVVEDESSVRETLVANLELDERFEVTGAETGEEALAKIQVQPFDIVVSDVRMPGMNGVELFRHIERLRPGMPFLLMTAFALEGLVQEAVQEGVFTVLLKPTDVETLVNVIVQASRRPAVLIVDGDAAIAHETAECLRASGVRAAAAYDSQGAVHAVREGTIDVCVLDLFTPGLDDLAVIEHLHATKAPVSLIAVLGDGSIPAALLKIAGQMQGMVRKPIERRELVDAIARARRAASASSSPTAAAYA
jgi:two-component system, NtrC family, response regulator HydG